MKTGKLNITGNITSPDYNRLIDNIVLNSFRIQVVGSLSLFQMEDGVIDEFIDLSGFDAISSSLYEYNSGNSFLQLSPTGETTEVDNMEYADNATAQSNYVSDDGGSGGSLNVYSEDTIVDQGTYSLKVVADSGSGDNSQGKQVVKTFGVPVDVSDRSQLKLSIRSDRTGSNIRVRTGDSMSIDTDDKLMLHLDGIDGATSTTDSSASGHVITLENGAELDTAQKKFGTASLLLDKNTSDYISIPDSEDFNFGTGNFTIDCWVRFNDLSANTNIFSHSTNGSDRISLFWLTSTNEIRFFQTTPDLTITKNWTPSTGVWYHFALIRGWGGNANDWAMTVDGTILGTSTTDSVSYANTSGEFRVGVGMNSEGTSVNYLDGWIDEFKISKGIARWTSNFTAPTQAYGSLAMNELITINVADTWETKEFSIDTAILDFPTLTFYIENSDSQTIYYIDEVYAFAPSVSMTLVSENIEAEVQPTEGRLLILEEDIDVVTVNTDIKGYISSDDGVNYDEVTLYDEGDFDASKRILSGRVDLTDLGDKTMRWKIVTDNTKDMKIHSVGLMWR